MILTLLKNKGIPLPAAETEDGLSAKDIMDKVRSFYVKFEKCEGEESEYAEGEFLELLYQYPKSMVARHMTDTLKTLIALIYFESKPEKMEKKEPTTMILSNGRKITFDWDDWEGYSYDDLALMFDLSKASIHEAIRQKEAEAKQLLEESKLRKKAKTIALEELVKEEKLKLLEKNLTESKETTEQTLHR